MNKNFFWIGFGVCILLGWGLLFFVESIQLIPCEAFADDLGFEWTTCSLAYILEEWGGTMFV